LSNGERSTAELGRGRSSSTRASDDDLRLAVVDRELLELPFRDE